MAPLLLIGCLHPAPLATVNGEAMGGGLEVRVRCAGDHADCLAEGVAARERVEELHRLATDWGPEGEIAQVNAAAGLHGVELSEDTAAMMGSALAAARLTGGAFDPSIGALWGLWDFEEGTRPDPESLASALARVDHRRVVLEGRELSLPEEGMALSLGGLAQGYAAQAALQRIQSDEALVDVSGDLAARGCWEVGVQHPRAPRGEAVASLRLCDAALSTSGDYERFFEEDGVRYHHILDPRTGLPGRGASSATVVGQDGALVDALATALVVLGPDAELVEAAGVWALVITPEGQLHELGERGEAVRRLRTGRVGGP